jgi:hypothetical protein
LSLATFFEGGNIEEEYAFPLLMIALFCFLKYFLTDSITRMDLIVCGSTFAAVCLICYPISLLLLCLSGHYFHHYGLLICPLFAWTVARALSFSEQSRTVQKRKTANALTLALAVCMLFNSTFLSIARSIADPLRHVEKQPQVKTIVDEVNGHTLDGDKISVMGNCNRIYLLSGRSSASKYSYQDPIAAVNPEILKEYLRDLQTLDAKMIIVDNTCSFYDSIKDDLKKVTDSGYRLLDRVDQMEVYVRI